MVDTDDFHDMFEEVEGSLDNFHVDVGDALGERTVQLHDVEGRVFHADRVRIEQIAGEPFVVALKAITHRMNNREERVMLPSATLPVERVAAIKSELPQPNELPENVEVEYPGVGDD